MEYPPPTPPSPCCDQMIPRLGRHDLNPTVCYVTAAAIATRPHWYPGATRQGFYTIVDILDREFLQPTIRYDLLSTCPFCGQRINQ